MSRLLFFIGLGLLGSASQAAAPARPDSFLEFWSRFRAAALTGNMPALRGMTKVPLEIGFDSDQDLERTVSNSQFSMFMRTELRCQSAEGNSNLEMFRTRPRADGRYNWHNTSRAVVGAFEFLNGTAGWRLSMVSYAGPESLQYRLKGRCD